MLIVFDEWFLDIAEMITELMDGVSDMLGVIEGRCKSYVALKNA